MQLLTFVILFSVLIAKVNLAGIIIEIPKPDNLELVEAAIEILKSCFADRINTVGIAGVSTGAISKTLSLRALAVPVTLIGDTSRTVKDGPGKSESRYKLLVFVVTVTNSSTLSETLTQIKSFIWWNHMASFILIDSPESKRGCSNVFEILRAAWEMNLLRATFMCLHPTKGRLIYTFNPYKNVAPVPWKVENTYKGKNDHIWTLFVRTYQEDEEICENLDFDKAIDLAGYEIRCSVTGKTKLWYSDFNTISCIDHVQKISARILIRTLNTTPKFIMRNADDVGHMDHTGKAFGIVADVVNGISDISLILRSTAVMANMTNTYPHAPSGLIALTNFRGHKSQMEKISSVLDDNSRIGLSLVFLITLLFFKCILRKPLMTATLNVLLIICNASIPKIPTQLAPRIYLGSLFLLAVTIQGIYQGKLSSLLTKKERLPNINKMEDLSHAGYTVYGHSIHRSLFADSIVEGRYVGKNSYNCTNEVLRDSKAACISEKWFLSTDAAYFKLHRSKDLLSLHMCYQLRPDWPLEERVNKILSRTFEGHVVETMFAREFRSTLNTLDYMENGDKDNSFKVINVQDLSFIFVILGIGLGCATISFIVEIGIRHARLGNVKGRWCIRRRREN